MLLSTPVVLPAVAPTLDIDSRVLLLGSCFSDGVGEQLRQRMGEDNVLANPFGVLYNPVSIAQALRMTMAEGTIPEECIFKGQDNLWHSWLHTSHYSATTREECMRLAEESLLRTREFLKKATLLIVTFGTTHCYRHVDSSILVANCHKEPQRCFIEEDPSLNELITLWTSVTKDLRAFNPSLQILFTVSPYRYRKYGMHESQIQKSKLLLLTDALDASYFPSYEILLDELRDYRFYADDMLHPSDLAVKIIADRFAEWSFTQDLQRVAEENVKAYRRAQHRNINKA